MPELTRRYIVMQMATEAPFDLQDPDAPFVLKPWKDPAALRALEAYREHCYPELAGELDQWIKAIRSRRADQRRGWAPERAHAAAAAQGRLGLRQAQGHAQGRLKPSRRRSGQEGRKKKGKRRS